MRVMALFSISFFAKCLRVGEDGPGRGHLCHTDTFLVFFLVVYFCFAIVWSDIEVSENKSAKGSYGLIV